MAGLTEAGYKTTKTHWRGVKCASRKFNHQVTQMKRSLFKAHYGEWHTAG